jgi:hypothetical protein
MWLWLSPDSWNRLEGWGRSDRAIDNDGRRSSSISHLSAIWSMETWSWVVGAPHEGRGNMRSDQAYDSRRTDVAFGDCIDLARLAFVIRWMSQRPFYSAHTERLTVMGPSLAWALGGRPWSPWVSAGPGAETPEHGALGSTGMSWWAEPAPHSYKLDCGDAGSRMVDNTMVMHMHIHIVHTRIN